MDKIKIRRNGICNITQITFILASSKMGNMMKTGSTGVERYNLPSTGEENNND